MDRFVNRDLPPFFVLRGGDDDFVRGDGDFARGGGGDFTRGGGDFAVSESESSSSSSSESDESSSSSESDESSSESDDDDEGGVAEPAGSGLSYPSSLGSRVFILDTVRIFLSLK